MEQSKLKEQVETIREAFGYITRFRDETFVLKIDDALLSEAHFALLMRDIVLLHRMGIRIILVPGARNRINEVLTAYNIPCDTVEGVRISTSEMIPLIKMAAFDVSNRLMTQLAQNGAGAVIGNWVRARSIGVRGGVDFQNSGTVDKLDAPIVRNVLDQGVIPIFPNIGWNSRGEPYNISSNELSLTISKELQAAKLFFIVSGPGILTADFPDAPRAGQEDIVPQLTADEAASVVNTRGGHEHSESLEMLGLAASACKSGIRRAHILDGRMEGVLLKEIFSNEGVGTMVYANQFENIRAMSRRDIPAVLRIMQPSVSEQALVPREAAAIEESVDEFVVYETDGTIHACAALHAWTKDCAEICALAVDRSFASHGIGGRIVRFLLDKAAAAGLERVFVLTTHTADWFKGLGFVAGKVEDLPEKRQSTYNRTRNSRVLFCTVGKNSHMSLHPRVE
jgi:amino-acid N-acetyltransferase